MKPLLLLSLLAGCAHGQTSFEHRLARMRAAEDRGHVGLALKSAYLAFADRTGRGFTTNQLQAIASTVQVYWMPESWECRFHHRSLAGGTLKKCSGSSDYDAETDEWTVKVVARECLSDTSLIDEWLHILRYDTYRGMRDPGDIRHIDERVFEHPDIKAAPRFSAEWLARKAFVEAVGCER